MDPQINDKNVKKNIKIGVKKIFFFEKRENINGLKSW